MSKKVLGVCALIGLLCALYFIRDAPKPVESREQQDPPLAAIPVAPSKTAIAGRAPVIACHDCAGVADRAEAADAPDTAALSVGAYQKQRMNVYFDAEEFVQDWLAIDDGLVRHLADHLEQPPSIDNPNSFLLDQPPIALERMAYIDVLEQVAATNVTESSSGEACEILARIIEKDLPSVLSTPQKRMMVGEKYDALNALARVSPEEAARAFTKLDSGGKQDALKGAILSALLDRGAKRGNVLTDFDKLLAMVE